MKKIKASEVVSVLRGLNGKIFSVEFERKMPKCECCGERSASWKELKVCPKCGGVISHFAFTTARLGVQNPKNGVAPGKGKYVGVSFDEALNKGILKYYDMGKGTYRSCGLENIHRIVSGREDMVVE